MEAELLDFMNYKCWAHLCVCLCVFHMWIWQLLSAFMSTCAASACVHVSVSVWTFHHSSFPLELTQLSILSVIYSEASFDLERFTQRWHVELYSTQVFLSLLFPYTHHSLTRSVCFPPLVSSFSMKGSCFSRRTSQPSTTHASLELTSLGGCVRTFCLD